jgi:DUF4097 and DUF4098 domain-containing protein YvlB
MKTLRWILPVAAVLCFVTAAGPVAAKRVEEKVPYQFESSAQPRLSLKNINGSLTIEGWDKKQIEVVALKSASPAERLEEIDIRCEMNNDHLRIEVEIDDDGNWTRGQSASVDFTIRVPHGTRVDAVELVNGSIEITGLGGDVEVSSVNGDVVGENLGGDVELATVNGDVSLLATGKTDSIRMHSVNGGVILTLPKKFDARIQAGTVHGSIRAEGGLDVDATTFSGTSMNATIGKGGIKVDLNTVNGSIEIRREGEGGSRDKE